MKKIILSSIVLTGFLLAGIPVHNKLDPRLTGKSFGGELDDDIANEDGLGALSLQHHSGTAEINNELKVQKLLKVLIKSTPDNVNKSNLKSALLSGLIGTVEQKTILENLNEVDSSSSSSSNNLSCKDIMNNGNSTGNGIYTISLEGHNDFSTYCDMTTDGGGWTLITNINTLTNLSLNYKNSITLNNNLSNKSLFEEQILTLINNRNSIEALIKTDTAYNIRTLNPNNICHDQNSNFSFTYNNNWKTFFWEDKNCDLSGMDYSGFLYSDAGGRNLFEFYFLSNPWNGTKFISNSNKPNHFFIR